MGGGNRTPSSSTPEQHSERFETGVSQAGVVGGSGRRVMSDGGSIKAEDSEIRDKWARPNGDVLISEGNDLFSQVTVNFTGNDERTLGIQDSWSELDSAAPDAVAASEFAGGRNDISAVMDDDGELFDAGSRELQATGLQNKIAGTANNYDAESVKALGSKINQLREEHGGSFNFHDPDVAEEFSLGEKEILANWEMAGKHTGSASDFSDESGFMDTAVVTQSDSRETMASKLEENGEVLVETHNNSRVDEVTSQLEDRAASGDIPSDVDVNELREKLHTYQESTHVVAVERDPSVDVETQVDNFSPARSGSARRMSAYSKTNEGNTTFTESEIEAVAATVIENQDIQPEEFKPQLMDTFGFREPSHDYEGFVSAPNEKMTVVTEEVGEDSVNLEGNFTGRGKFHSRETGLAENADPLSYGMDEVSCVYAETTRLNDGTETVTNVHVGTADDFNVTETDASRTATFNGDVDGVKTIEVDGGDPVSQDPAVQSAAAERADSGEGLSAPDDVNAAPDPSSVPTMSEIRASVEDELFGSGTEFFVDGREAGPESAVKQGGNDGEEVIKNAVYEDYDPTEVDPGESETNEYLDVTNALIEVKFHDSEGSHVVLGSEDPWSTEPADSSMSTDHTDWSKENCNASNVRYAVVEKNMDGVSANSLSMDDVEKMVKRQPSLRQNFFEDGVDSFKRIKNGESSISDEIQEDVADKLMTIEGAVIASGKAISESDEIDLNVSKEFEITPDADAEQSTLEDSW